MREYSGQSVKKYTQSESKLMRLFPAFGRAIPKVRYGAFLDVGCGIGDYSDYVIQKGYRYYGIDASKDMTARAKTSYPQLNFKVSDATSFSKGFDIKFDVILISMVFITMNKVSDIVKILTECVKVLKDNGIVVIGDLYPAFSGYMRKFLFGEEDIETDFEGYFKSGKLYVNHKKFSSGNFDFYDYHWTLKDYFDSIKKAGLKVVELDECESDKKLRHLDPKYYEKTKFYPTFMVLTCKKNSF